MDVAGASAQLTGSRRRTLRLVAGLVAAAALFGHFVFQDGRRSGRPARDCYACHGGDAICDRWGQDALARSRSYVGSARGLAPFVTKLRRAESVTIGVVGGSVSACHEVDKDKCYHSVLARRLGPQVTVHNGGLGAAGSRFFSACWNVMITGDEDLVIVEFGVNDTPGELINRSLAVLLYSLLNRPKRPAILILDLYSPILDSWYGAGVGINVLGEYFDVPVVSQRNVLYHWRHRHPSEFDRWWIKNKFFPNGHHPTDEGHDLVADLIRSLLEERACLEAEPQVPRLGAWEEGDFPAIPARMPWHSMNETVESAAAETGAWCQAASPGPFQLTLSAGSKGFDVGHWNDKTFLQGRSVGDTAVLEHVVIHDIVRIFFWRSRTIGLGTALCSVNGGKPVPLNGYWDSKINGPDEGIVWIDRSLVGTKVRLVCTIIESSPRPDGAKTGSEFRISAVAW